MLLAMAVSILVVVLPKSALELQCRLYLFSLEFLTRDDFGPQEHLAVFGDNFGSHSWRGGAVGI